MGKYLVISGADFSQVAVERLTFPTIITEFDVSNVKNVKYASQGNQGFFYYTLAQASSAIENISYIIPYKIKVGSAVTIKFKEGAKHTQYGAFGALHSFSEVPANLSPYELLDSKYGGYVNMYSHEFTYIVKEGYQYVELYLFSNSVYSPSDISDSIESITIIVDDGG